MMPRHCKPKLQPVLDNNGEELGEPANMLGTAVEMFCILYCKLSDEECLYIGKFESFKQHMKEHGQSFAKGVGEFTWSAAKGVYEATLPAGVRRSSDDQHLMEVRRQNWIEFQERHPDVS